MDFDGPMKSCKTGFNCIFCMCFSSDGDTKRTLLYDDNIRGTTSKEDGRARIRKTAERRRLDSEGDDDSDGSGPWWMGPEKE